jgi:hypothetical protein
MSRPRLWVSATTKTGKSGKTFADDVLRIEISGPRQDHLALVDFPGLFHSSSATQSEADKTAVFGLVQSFIKRARCIILAVVSAMNDANNQAVLQMVRKHDPTGMRTLGIITKPDTLAKGSPSETDYIALASNIDVKFDLGWHVVRNRSWEERNATSAERDRNEERFFSQCTWQSPADSNKGIKNLRVRLSNILHDHILHELPDLLKDVTTDLENPERKPTALDQPRAALSQQRLCLVDASRTFETLAGAAIRGGYDSDTFFEDNDQEDDFQKRLCAVVPSILEAFRRTMCLRGHKIKMIDRAPASANKPSTPKSTKSGDKNALSISSVDFTFTNSNTCDAQPVQFEAPSKPSSIVQGQLRLSRNISSGPQQSDGPPPAEKIMSTGPQGLSSFKPRSRRYCPQGIWSELPTWISVIFSQPKRRTFSSSGMSYEIHSHHWGRPSSQSTRISTKTELESCS